MNEWMDGYTSNGSHSTLFPVVNIHDVPATWEMRKERQRSKAECEWIAAAADAFWTFWSLSTFEYAQRWWWCIAYKMWAGVSGCGEINYVRDASRITIYPMALKPDTTEQTIVKPYVALCPTRLHAVSRQSHPHTRLRDTCAKPNTSTIHMRIVRSIRSWVSIPFAKGTHEFPF